MTDRDRILGLLDEIHSLVEENGNADGTLRFDTLRAIIALDFVKTEIEKMIFVEKATVTKDLIGNIKIRIKENNASLYGYINNILYVADQDGILEQDQQQKWISYVQRCPQMMNFDEEHFQSFVKAYVKLPSVVQNQISSIVFEPDEKDQTKCKLELDDGKIFYVRIEDMEKQLTSTNYYLVIQSYPDYKYYDFLGKNVYVYN